MKNVLIVVDEYANPKKLFESIRQMDTMKEATFVITCIEPSFRFQKKEHSRFEDVLIESMQSGVKVIRIQSENAKRDIGRIIANYQIDEIYSRQSVDGLLSYFKPSICISRFFLKPYVVVTVKDWNMKERSTRLKIKSDETMIRSKESLLAFLAVILTTGICYLLKDIIGYQTVGLVFLILVAFLSLTLGRAAIIITAVLTFFIWNFFFITPTLTLHIENAHDVILLFANLAVALTGGTLISRLRQNQLALQKSKARISLLYSLLESLNNTTSIKGVVEKVRAELHEHFDADAIIYLKEKEGHQLAKKIFGNPILYSDEAYEVASKVFYQQSLPSNIKFTSLGQMQYFVLSGNREAFGIIGISTHNKQYIDEEKLIFLKSFITQISSALEREINIDKAKEVQVMQESQKLFQTVLNSVSHELKTPVSIIRSAVSNLLDEKTASNPESRRQICQELDLSAYRLNMLVENILNMSKIESGYLNLDIQLCDASDLTGVVLKMLNNKTDLKHTINVEISDSLPLLSIDINWMKQVLYNILNNALLYTPEGTVICLKIDFTPKQFIIEISDNGPGVPASEIEKLFDKFYRIQGSRSGGTGLGLAISQAIVEAHKGSIKASNLSTGGLCICIELPLLIG